MRISEETYKLGSFLLLKVVTFKGTPVKRYSIVDKTDNATLWSLSAEIDFPKESFENAEKIESETFDV